MKRFLISLLLLPIGCHPVQVWPMKNGEGKTIYKIELKAVPGDCRRKADEICGGPYTVIAHDDNQWTGGHRRWLFNWCQLTVICDGKLVTVENDYENRASNDVPSLTANPDYYCYENDHYVRCSAGAEGSTCYTYGNSIYCR